MLHVFLFYNKTNSDHLAHERKFGYVSLIILFFHCVTVKEFTGSY